MDVYIYIYMIYIGSESWNNWVWEGSREIKAIYVLYPIIYTKYQNYWPGFTV